MVNRTSDLDHSVFCWNLWGVGKLLKNSSSLFGSMATKKGSLKVKKKPSECLLDRTLNFVYDHHVELLVVAVTMLAFYYRILPARFEYLTAIDPYYLYRMNLYAVTHSLQLPHLDLMRYYPTGIDPHDEYPGMYIVPAFIYLIFTKLLRHSIDFWIYAKIEPAVMGALFTVLIYLIGKELYNKYSGLAAAFFYATLAGVMFRTSAGFFEKEPNAGFFMLLSFYFFVRAIKRDSVFSAIASGLSMAIMATMWGGVQQLYLGYALFVFALLLVNNVPESVVKTYTIVCLLSMIPLFMPIYKITKTIFAVNIGALVFLWIREFVKRKNLISREKFEYFMPIMFSLAVVGLIVGGMVSGTIARIAMGIHHYLFYHQALVESTVAEDIIPTVNDFTHSLSLYYVTSGYVNNSFLSSFKFLFKLLPMWLFALIGIIYLGVRGVKERREKILVTALLLISFFSYYQFLKLHGHAIAQAMFIFPFMAVIFMLARSEKGVVSALYLSMVAVAMLGYLSKIRWMFGLALMFSIMSGFCVAKLWEFFRQAIERIPSRLALEGEDAATIKHVLYGVLGFIVFTGMLGYIANAGVLAKSLSPSFNKNWEEAMKFLREKTEPNATVLSWWDFGYWFETVGNRSTNLDGGNNFPNRNIPTAQYFTGMMNETQQKFFLEMMGTDYVLVDASMIGKYAAMSKIAQMITKRKDYYKIRSYSYFFLDPSRTMRKGNVTVFVYRSGNYALWVPIKNDGRLGGSIALVTPRGIAYIKYLCTQNSIYKLDVPEGKPALNMCVVLTSSVALLATKDMFNSVFHRLFFMNGKGIDYLTKVFDNGEIKIYKVNHTIIPDRSRNELIKWWKKYGWKGLIVYNGTNWVRQARDYSVFNN